MDIVKGNIKRANVEQKKTKFEDNQKAKEFISKRSGKEYKEPNKSASKTSSLDVWDTKPDTPGKLKALKTQLEKKKKTLPTSSSYKTMQKRQANIERLESEIQRLEEKLGWEAPSEKDLEGIRVIEEEIAEIENTKNSRELDVDYTQEEYKQMAEAQEGMDFDTVMESNPENMTKEELQEAREIIQEKMENKNFGTRNEKGVKQQLERIRKKFREIREEELKD